MSRPKSNSYKVGLGLDCARRSYKLFMIFPSVLLLHSCFMYYSMAAAINPSHISNSIKLTASNPTVMPTPLPTAIPTAPPSRTPTSKPSRKPTQQSSNIPTKFPSNEPTLVPTLTPSDSSYFNQTDVYKVLTAYGTGEDGYDSVDRDAKTSSLDDPSYLTFDKSINIYLSDSNNNVIRLINGTTNIIQTVAGSALSGYNGDGPALSVKLNKPRGIVFSLTGNIYFGDCGNLLIRKLTTISSEGITTISDGVISTQANLSVISYNNMNIYSNNKNVIYNLAIDSDDVIYVADSVNCLIYNISTDSTPGKVSLFAGLIRNGVPVCGNLGTGKISHCELIVRSKVTVSFLWKIQTLYFGVHS